MLCDSCGVDIPPAWIKVIASNVCVECSGPIMSDGTIELMNGLKEALEKMPNDPQGIAGWLLSNYQMRKVGNGEPTEFIGVKPKHGSGPVNEQGLKIAGTPLERFKKLAGVKVEAPEKYKSLISEINSGVLDGESEEFENQNNEELLPNMDSSEIEYTKQALKSMMSPAGAKNHMRKQAKEVEPEFDEDLTGLHPGLHEDRLARIEKQKDLVYGGSVGKIKRS